MTFTVLAGPWYPGHEPRSTVFARLDTAIQNAEFVSRRTGQNVRVFDKDGNRVFYAKGDSTLRRKTWAAYSIWDGNAHHSDLANRRVQVAAMKHRKRTP